MKRMVNFDFEIQLAEGAILKGEDFLLTIAGESIDDNDILDHVINSLRLPDIGDSKVLYKQIISGPHERKSLRTGRHQNQLIDLSHTIENGLITYKGLPAPVICDYLSRQDSRKFYEEGTEFQIGKIEMVSNTGTYIDCPFHRFENGNDLSQMALENFTDLDGVVIRIPFKNTLEITEQHLQGIELKHKAVLIHTGWGDAHWNTPAYYEKHPYLTTGAAEYLRDCGITLAGIDSHNIDDTTGRSRPVHTVLLGAGILIVEHLCNLMAVPDKDFLFSAIPPKFKGVGTFPVRAMAKVKTTT
jgi:arylformamidase